jgi:integrase
VDAERTTIQGRGWTAFRRSGQWVVKYKARGKWTQHRLPRRVQSEADVRHYVAVFLRAERAELKERAVAPAPPVVAGITRDLRFRELAALWTGGELASRFPDHVRVKRSTRTDKSRLDSYILPHIGDRLVVEFEGTAGVDIASEVMTHLPPLKDFSRSSRRQVAQIIHRLLGLAAFPLRLLSVNPLPRGWLPRISEPKAKSYIYPREDEKLLGCTQVPLLNRLYYGFLAREGLRASEARGMQIRDVDLRHGVINLDQNKTNEPRAWPMYAGVRDALKRYLARQRPNAKPDDLLFADASGRRPPGDGLARALRRDLRQAGVKRRQLFQVGEHRLRLRGHDLRATFVTTNLAAGETETWISDRTGHTSSKMIATYRRTARTHRELKLGKLEPLVDAIPELRDAAERSATVHTLKRPTSRRARADQVSQVDERVVEPSAAEQNAPPSSPRRRASRG